MSDFKKSDYFDQIASGTTIVLPPLPDNLQTPVREMLGVAMEGGSVGVTNNTRADTRRVAMRGGSIGIASTHNL